MGSYVWNLILTTVMLMSIMDLSFGSRAFSKNLQDRRCRKRGQFLAHPSDRCKYIVCEFSIGSDRYTAGRLYATEMPCAPGTEVSTSAMSSGRSLYGNPCTETSGRCRRSSAKSGYGRASISFSSIPSHRSRSSSSSSSSSNSGYPAPSSGGRWQSTTSLAARRQRLTIKTKPRPQTSYAISQSFEEPITSYSPQPQPQSMPSYRQASSHSSSSSSSLFGSRVSARALEQTHFQNHFQDGRCTRLGEYLAHPTDRCKYIVCEFALNTMRGYGGNAGIMYAREMKCAPGTVVSSSRYSDMRRGWKRSPCTDHYEGYCPASVSSAEQGVFSSSTAGGAFHPLNKPRSSRSSNEYTVYWV